MMKKHFVLLLVLLFHIPMLQAQDESMAEPAKKSVKSGFEAFNGIIATGYVDQGAYLNFTGPCFFYKFGYSKLVLGMLPSLRFKEDQGDTRNAFVTPTLGFGLTYAYKHLVFQLPLYYNPKTSTQNGQWNPGIGLGFRFDW
ncbi:hypothetical protein [Eisenibacter elegans]|jgi:hypothetical protein|uniref:hypothetical protein n=1 Tax=Eisenibacter elegans TaxID=997 RepID=UPI000417E003|nr:hypothetical protein [Eisenibacter elegans]